MKNSRFFIPRVSALLLFVSGTLQAAFLAQIQSGLGDDPVVMTINGEPVSTREYTLVMMRRAGSVYAFFKEHHDLDEHAGYWKDHPDPSAPSPIRLLREKVREELVRIKVTQALARQKELVDGTTFAAFLQKWETENERRLKAIAANEVVYGPKQYGESAYYYICFGDLNHRLQQALSSAPERKIAEEQLEAYYAANKSRYGDTPFSDVREKIETIIQNENHKSMINTLCQAAKVEVDDTRLRALAPRKDD